DAAEKGTPVTLPVTAEAGGLPVTVTLPKDAGPVAVEIPAENLTPGTAAVIVHEDGTEELVRASVNGEKGVILKIEGSATVKMIDNTKTFPDVPPGSLSEPYITWAASRGLFLGTEEGFEPGADMTRGMLATVLYRLDGSSDVGENSFGDVPEGMWFTDAVAWANKAGIAAGTGEGFEPNAPVTREQTAVMLYRYANFLGLDTGSRASLDGFPDGGLCENWAKDAMSWAVSAGLFPDSGDGALDPGGITTRAEAAEMIYRLAEIIVKQG
ncbi:MAG: S-layer homology domain-containing protein, partial [Oscillospiraceae bacterium]|nr:S-layer homology domain-containing protein [Oscillospiraceae bacterium]